MDFGRNDYKDNIKCKPAFIPKDEPVFLLRARDPFAAGIVREWSDDLERCGGNPAMVQSARDHARKLEAWNKKIEGAEFPDLPE
jgi:hypothetical protein